MRRLARALRIGVSLQWRAARRESVVVVAVQLSDALLLAAQLWCIRHVLELLSRDVRPSFSAFVPWLAAITATYGARAMSGTFVSERQQLISEVVQRDVSLRILAIATRAEVADFEDAEFHDRLRRIRAETYRHVWNTVWAIVNLSNQVLVSVSMTLVLVAVAPLVLAVALVGMVPFLWANRRRNKLAYDVAVEQTTRDRELFYLEHVLTDRPGIGELRAYGLGDHLLERVRRLYDLRIAALRRASDRKLRVSLVSSGLGALLAAAAMATLVVVAVNGDLSIADAGIAVLALQQVTNQFRGVIGVVGEIDYAALFLDEYARFEREDAERRDDEERRATIDQLPPLATLALDGVSFTYPGAGVEVLHDVHLTLGRGEVVAIVGHNGSGKTTLAKLLAGLYSPTSGTIRWNGTDRSAFDDGAVRRAVALVFQSFGRYELTAHDNVAFGDVARHADRAAVVDAARRSGADDFLVGLAHGYDTRLSRSYEEGAELSGGQWQRVALARAFFRDAPVIVLDEPSAALDPEAEHELFQRLRELCEGRTTVLISHRFSTVRDADRIVVLDGGRIVEHGTHDELLALGGRYAALFTLQAAPYQARAGSPD